MKNTYDINALKSNIEKCNSNIKLFQDAIAKEYEAIAQLKQLIQELETQGNKNLLID